MAPFFCQFKGSWQVISVPGSESQHSLGNNIVLNLAGTTGKGKTTMVK
jgi:tRNA A37 threonylcarbamoyladenosine biosynthesis protein TsaE